MANNSKCGNGLVRGRRVPLFGGVVTAMLVAASCSASVQSGAESTTTAANAPTTSTGSTSDLTKADLEVMLPTAKDVGSGYRLDTSDDGADTDQDDGIDAAMRQACPAVSKLMGDDDGNADDDDGLKAERKFAGLNDKTISVKLNGDVSSTKTPDRAALSELVDAVEVCDEITFSDSGVDFTGKLFMQLNPRYGDFGATLRMRWQGESEQLPAPIKLDGVMQLFVVDDVGVSVSALGGVDTNRLEGVPADEDLVDKLSEQIEGELEAA